MIDNDLDTSTTAAKIRAMMKLGVPYPENYDQFANTDLMKQAERITKNLKKDGIKVENTKEIVAMIAYLQRLGTDIKAEKKESN
jgi:cytochrome c oxidase cbb3-type subunit I/II